ncbi:MAG: DUF4837 family protein [Flavobacteriales bacterium]|nr:DUF4837 family protein [Flavobacteriales bacterium]
MSGCDERANRLPESAGGQDEVLVVMSKGHWESAPGSAVRAILEQPMQGLPQPERLFRVAQCQPQDFASLLAVHHSVLYADIGSDSTGVAMLRDAHARGQLLIRVADADGEAWVRAWHSHADAAVRAWEDHQRTRIGAQLQRERDAAIIGQVKGRLGIDLDIPGGYRVMKIDSTFAWLQRDRIMSGSGLEHNVIEGLLIHIHPYASDSTWTVPFLVDQRDAVTRTGVPGPVEGSYMIVQRGFEQMNLMPTGRALRLRDRFAYLMRGLYGMHGAKMGGPFVSLSTLDAAESRVITVEGFVYAPQFDKRAYVRELEAILFSLRDDGSDPLSAKQ